MTEANRAPGGDPEAAFALNTGVAQAASDGPVPLDWQMLTPELRATYRARLVRWLQAAPDGPPKMLEALVPLVVDRLIFSAYREFNQLQRQTSGFKTGNGPGAADSSMQAARGAALVFRQQIATLLSQDPEAGHRILRQTFDYWRYCPGADDGDIDTLLDYAGDQLVAGLTLQNLHRFGLKKPDRKAEGGDSRPEKPHREEAERDLWNSLAARMVRKLILPGPRGTTRARYGWLSSEREELVRECLFMMLEYAAPRAEPNRPKYMYQGLGQGIRFFQQEWARRESQLWAQRQEFTPSAKGLPPSELRQPAPRPDDLVIEIEKTPYPLTPVLWDRMKWVHIPETAAGCALLYHLCETQDWTWFEIADLICQQAKGSPVSCPRPGIMTPRLIRLALAALYDNLAETGELSVALQDWFQYNYPMKTRAWRLFLDFCTAFKGRKAAIRFWIVNLIYEDRLSSTDKDLAERSARWEETAAILALPRCQSSCEFPCRARQIENATLPPSLCIFLSDGDLPPSASREEIQQLFASRTLNGEALKMDRHRLRQTLKQSLNLFEVC